MEVHTLKSAGVLYYQVLNNGEVSDDAYTRSDLEVTLDTLAPASLPPSFLPPCIAR
jgi:hypothetical protein